MASNQGLAQISLTSLKFIFQDGTVSGKLTKEALDVCRLLAIDPQDVIQRNLEDFKEPGFSDQRIKLKFDYYQEKKHLKLKAIENILLKIQKGPNGQMAEDAQQVLTLLEDVKNIRMGTNTARQRNGKMSKTFQRSTYMSPDTEGRNNYFGNTGSKSQKGLNFNSPATFKSKKALDRLPNNLIDKSGQERMVNVMRATFITDSVEDIRQPYKSGGSLSQAPVRKVFDTFTHGFELPASQQLNRINWKLNRWLKTNELVEQRKHEQQEYQKKLNMKIDKKLIKTEKLKTQNIKSVFQRVQQKHEVWTQKVSKHKLNNKTYDNEVSQEASLDQLKWEELGRVRQIDIFKDGSPDKRKPEEIVADNYNQVKEREQNHLNHTWEDYECAQTNLNGINQSLNKGENRYNNVKKGKVEKLTQYIEYVDSIKDVKKEIDEKQEYQFLNHVVLQDKQGKKSLNTIDKTLKHTIQTKQEKHNELRQRTMQHYKTQQEKQKEESQDISNRIAKRDEKERRAREVKATYVSTQAEKRKLREQDIKQNQHTMKLMKDVKAYKVYEKHIQKEKYMSELGQKMLNVEKQRK